MALPGHTHGHIAYYSQDHNLIFSGDVLFGLGCGRLFEGTAEEAYKSLALIKKLPRNTLVYCTHEYTETNLNFCESVLHADSDEFKKYKKELLDKRKNNQPSVPLLLESELRCNPFLSAVSADEFAAIRSLRNQF